MTHYMTATVFGGTGFVGRQIVRALAKRGIIVKVASRAPERAYFLRTCGTVGQVVPLACDYSASSIAKAVRGSDFAVNCIGVLYERRKGEFRHAHVDVPARIAEACKAEKVTRFIHISAAGIDEDKSRYARTKLEGEEKIRAVFPKAVILRSSIVFGPDDDFFNRFAGMARMMPALPLIGGGKTRFQPVYVGDVADAAMAAIDHDETQGRTFELGGPEILTFREIMERMFKYTHRRRTLVSLPWGVAGLQACILGLMPNPLLTRDQVISLKSDHVAGKDALKLQDLGVTPTGMDLILPTYLESYRPGGRFAGGRAA